jgi:hypothetical protein
VSKLRSIAELRAFDGIRLKIEIFRLAAPSRGLEAKNGGLKPELLLSNQKIIKLYTSTRIVFKKAVPSQDTRSSSSIKDESGSRDPETLGRVISYAQTATEKSL